MKLFIALLCCVVMGLWLAIAYHAGYQAAMTYIRQRTNMDIACCPFQPPQPCSTLPKLAKE